jgi:hypothetical protein
MQSATVNGATALNGGVAMAVQGTIKASEDVLAGAISLAKHAHGGVKAGGDNSDGPQLCESRRRLDHTRGRTRVNGFQTQSWP